MPFPAHCTRVVINKPIWGVPAGTELIRFPLKECVEINNMEVLKSFGHGWRPVTNVRNPDGSLLWLSHGFVSGDFNEDEKPKFWTPTLFTPKN